MISRLKEVKGIRGVVLPCGPTQNANGFPRARGVRFSGSAQRAKCKRPAITAVVVGRNDDYMSDFVHRLRTTIAWNIKYLANEVVLWNGIRRPIVSFSASIWQNVSIACALMFLP